MSDIKLSSTRLQTWFDCPARWYYKYVVGDGTTETNEAMAVGTVFHAIQEYRGLYGWFPTETDVRQMEGNYEDPRVAMDAFPDAWPIARNMARKNPIPEGDYEVEVPLEDLGLEIHGVPVTGFFDLLDRPGGRILDWKTRSRMDYAPRTLEDFMGKAQPLYYPAAARKAFGWDTVKFTHLNVLRPGGKLCEVTVELDGHILDAFWDNLEQNVVPRMLEIVDGADPETDESACWKYGSRCPFWDPCQEDDAPAFLDMGDEVKIVSDEAPDNIEPVPYGEKTVDKLGFDSRQVRKAQELGLYTMADLDEWLAEGNELDDIPYVGETTAESALEVKRSLEQSKVGQ